MQKSPHEIGLMRGGLDVASCLEACGLMRGGLDVASCVEAWMWADVQGAHIPCSLDCGIARWSKMRMVLLLFYSRCTINSNESGVQE